MQNKLPWHITLMRVLLILVATALLLLAVMQRVIIAPSTCTAALRAWSATPWARTLAHASVDAIPAAQWSPYITRDPDALAQVYMEALDFASLEAPFCAWTQSMLRYWLGMSDGDTVRSSAADLVAHFDADWSQRTRASLWESLPECTPEIEGACIPADPGLRNEYALEHAAWWESYALGLRLWLSDAVIMTANSILPFQPWLMRWHVLDLLPLVLLVLGTLFLNGRTLDKSLASPRPSREGDGVRMESDPVRDPRRRWDFKDDLRWYRAGALWVITGIVISVLAVLPMLVRFPAPVVSLAVPAAWQPLIESAWHALWATLLNAFAWRALPLGALLFAMGLGLSAIAAYRRIRWLLLLLAMLIASGALLFNRSAHNSLLPQPSLVMVQATPTVLPTLTPTPTPTPTPVPTYWPVQTGTPVPTPAGTLDGDLPVTLLGCVQGADTGLPVQWLQVDATGFTVYQKDSYARFALPSLARVNTGENAYPLDALVAYVSGKRVAVAQAENLWIYNIPTWIPAMPSRFSAFADITALGSDASQTTDRILLGLEDGFIWEVRASTGGLLAMHAVSERPITGVTQCGSMLLASEDNGLQRVWDWAEGIELALWQQHHAPIKQMTCSADGQRALSLDEDGRLVLWDLGTVQYQQQRDLGAAPTSGIIHKEETLWFGTRAGDILAVDDNDLTMQRFPISTEPVTAVALSEDNLLFSGSAVGQVCLWAAVQVP